MVTYCHHAPLLKPVWQGLADELLPALDFELPKDCSGVGADGLDADLHLERNYGVRGVVA